MKFLPDQPILTSTDDTLGFTPFVEQLHDAVMAANLPFVFGLLGDWGTGKTSILRLLESRLGSHLYLIPIWFDAWRYENETNIVYPLLHAIDKRHKELTSPNNDSFRQKFVDVVATSALAVTDLALRGATASLTGEAYKLEDINKWLTEVRANRGQITAVLENWTDEVENLRKGFAELLAAFARDIRPEDPSAVRFVILIDDLDRCLPETTVKLLENIKNHLDAPNVAYVLALNTAVVYQGIRHKYGGIEVNGREYLEKILNYTFYVPEPDLSELIKFTGLQMQAILPEPGNRDHFKSQLDEFGTALSKCRFSNPRKIKRILNRYVLFLNRLHDDLEKYQMPNVVRLIVLAEYFPDVFLILFEYLDGIRPGGRQTHFSLREFDTYYRDRVGAALFNRYPQLAIMQELFALQASSSPNEYNLHKYAAEVYRLTRLL